MTFPSKAHAAAMERCIDALLRQTPMGVERIERLTLGDLPREGEAALLGASSPSVGATARTAGCSSTTRASAIPLEAVPLRLRFAKSVRISMEGNAPILSRTARHPYADDEAEGAVPVITNIRTQRSMR